MLSPLCGHRVIVILQNHGRVVVFNAYHNIVDSHSVVVRIAATFGGQHSVVHVRMLATPVHARLKDFILPCHYCHRLRNVPASRQSLELRRRALQLQRKGC